MDRGQLTQALLAISKERPHEEFLEQAVELVGVEFHIPSTDRQWIRELFHQYKFLDTDRMITLVLAHVHTEFSKVSQSLPQAQPIGPADLSVNYRDHLHGTVPRNRDA